MSIRTHGQNAQQPAVDLWTATDPNTLSAMNDPSRLPEILEALGYRHDDRVKFASLTRTTTDWDTGWLCLASMSIEKIVSNWTEQLCTTPDVAVIMNQEIPVQDLYMGFCTHDGARKFTKANMVECTHLVLDVDVGTAGHRNASAYETAEEALAAVSGFLPPPTMVLNTGGGLNLYFRLAERLDVQEHLQEIEALSKRASYAVKGDTCHSVDHIFRFPLSINWKLMGETRRTTILQFRPDVDYTLDELNAYLDARDVPEAEEIQSVTKASSGSQSQSSGSFDSSAWGYHMVMDAVAAKVPERQIISKLKRVPDVWSHYNTENRARADIRRIRKKLLGGLPRPRTPVENVEMDISLSLPAIAEPRRIFDEEVFPTQNERIDAVLGLLDTAIQSGRNVIFNLPCGSSKTTSAIITVAGNASNSNRFWFVTEKVANVRRIAETLRILGCNAVEWHGFHEAVCEQKLTYQEFRDCDTIPCRECEHQQGCTATNRILATGGRWDCPTADVVVTTHAHWRAAMLSGKIPSSLRAVIVDEAPMLSETLTLTEADMSRLRRMFSPCADIAQSVCEDLALVIRATADGDCRRVTLNGIRRRTRLLKQCVLTRHEAGELDDSDLQLALELIAFAARGSDVYAVLYYKNGEKRTGAHYRLITGKVQIRTDVQHIVLDGSAKLSDVEWVDFTIWQAPELLPTYPNTTIHIIKANPSKTKLSDSQTFKSLESTALNVIQARPDCLRSIVFRNKTATEKIAKDVEGLSVLIDMSGVAVIPMTRGEHKGSNDGKEADAAVVAMSLFYDASYYVLRTALATGSGIASTRIWQTGKTFQFPKMKRNGGYTDKQIHQAFVRATADDLYQAIMRGKIRTDADAVYDVVCLLDSPEVISLLTDDLPGCTILIDGSNIIMRMMAGDSETQLAKSFQSGKEPEADRQKLKRIIEAFYECWCDRP